MVYSPTGSLDLFLILDCMTTLPSNSFRRIDTTVYAKLNKPPSQMSPPPSPPSLLSPILNINVFEIAPLPPQGGGVEDLIEELQYVDFIGADNMK